MSGEFDSIVPGTLSALVVPNDSADLDRPARSLYIETGGTIKFTTIRDETDTWNVPDGFIIPMQIKKVFAGGTTADGIHRIV